MKLQFKKTCREESTIEQFEDFIKLYSVKVWDVENGISYMCEKTGIKLKKSIRPVKDKEISANIIDIRAQTCSCEAFTRRHKQGICKHIRALNFAVQHKLMAELLEE